MKQRWFVYIYKTALRAENVVKGPNSKIVLLIVLMFILLVPVLTGIFYKSFLDNPSSAIMVALDFPIYLRIGIEFLYYFLLLYFFVGKSSSISRFVKSFGSFIFVRLVTGLASGIAFYYLHLQTEPIDFVNILPIAVYEFPIGQLIQTIVTPWLAYPFLASFAPNVILPETKSTETQIIEPQNKEIPDEAMISPTMLHNMIQDNTIDTKTSTVNLVDVSKLTENTNQEHFSDEKLMDETMSILESFEETNVDNNIEDQSETNIDEDIMNDFSLADDSELINELSENTDISSSETIDEKELKINEMSMLSTDLSKIEENDNFENLEDTNFDFGETNTFSIKPPAINRFPSIEQTIQKYELSAVSKTSTATLTIDEEDPMIEEIDEQQIMAGFTQHNNDPFINRIVQENYNVDPDKIAIQYRKEKEEEILDELEVSPELKQEDPFEEDKSLTEETGVVDVPDTEKQEDGIDLEDTEITDEILDSIDISEELDNLEDTDELPDLDEIEAEAKKMNSAFKEELADNENTELSEYVNEELTNTQAFVQLDETSTTDIHIKKLDPKNNNEENAINAEHEDHELDENLLEDIEAAMEIAKKAEEDDNISTALFSNVDDLKETGVFNRKEPEVHEDFKDTQIILRNLPDSIDFTNADMPDFIKFTLSDLLVCNPLNESVNLLKSLLKKDATFSIQIAAMQIRKLFETRNPYVTVEQIYAQAPFNAINFSSKNAGKDLSEAKLILPIKKIIDQFSGQLVLTKNHEDITVDTGNLVDLLKMDDKGLSDDTTSVFDSSKSAEEIYEMPILDEDLQTDLNPKSIGEYEPRFKEKFEPINDSDLKKADFIEDTGEINTDDTRIAPEIGTTEMNLKTEAILKNKPSDDKQAEDIFSMKVNKDSKDKKAPEVIDDTSELPALSEFESEIAPEIDFDIEEQLKNLYQKGQKIISMQKSDSHDKFSDNINKSSKAPEIDLELEKPPIDISNTSADIKKSEVAPEINDPANLITDKKDTVRNILQKEIEKEKPIAPEIDTQINPKDITTKLDKAPEIDLYENMSSKLFPEMEIFKEKEVDPDSTQERVLPKPGKESMIIRLNDGDLDDMDLDELLSHSLEDNTHEFKIVAEDLEDRSPKEALFEDVEEKDEKPEKLKTISFYEDPKKPSIMEQIEEHVKNQEKVEIPGEERFEYMKHSDFTDSRDELVVDYFKEMPKHEDTNEMVKKESELSELEREITQKNIKQNVFSQDDELQEDEDDTVQEYFARVNMGDSKPDSNNENSSSKALDEFDIPGFDEIFSENENSLPQKTLENNTLEEKTQDFTNDDITQKDIEELQQENFLDDIYQLIEDTEDKNGQKTESGMSFEQIVDIIKTDEYHEFLNSEKPKSKWAELGESVFDNEIFSESQDIDRPDSMLRFSMDEHPKNLGNEIQKLIKRNQNEPSVGVDHFDIHKDLFMGDHENILNSKELEQFNMTPQEEDRQKSDLEKIIRPAHEDYSDIFNDNFTSQFTIDKDQVKPPEPHDTTGFEPNQEKLETFQTEPFQDQSGFTEVINEEEMDISEFTIPSKSSSEVYHEKSNEPVQTTVDDFELEEEHIENIHDKTNQTIEKDEFPIDIVSSDTEENPFDFRTEIGEYSEEIIEEPDFEDNLDEGFFFETDISLYRKPPSKIDINKYKKDKNSNLSEPDKREEIALDKKEVENTTTTPSSFSKEKNTSKLESDFSFQDGINENFDDSNHIEEPELDTFMFEQISIGSQFDKTNTFVPSNDFSRPHIPQTKKSSFEFDSKKTTEHFDIELDSIDKNMEKINHDEVNETHILPSIEIELEEKNNNVSLSVDSISDKLLSILKSSGFFEDFDFISTSKNSILYIFDKKLEKYSNLIELNACSGFKSTIDYQHNNIAIMHGLFEQVKVFIFVETKHSAPKLLKIIEEFYTSSLESYSDSSFIDQSNIDNFRSSKLNLPVYSYSSKEQTIYISFDDKKPLSKDKNVSYITNIHEMLVLVDILNDSNHTLKDIVIDFDSCYCAVKYDNSIACAFINSDNQRIGKNLLMAKRLFNEILNRS